MGYINVSDGSITPTPPPPFDGPGDVPEYAADEQFANVFWQWHNGAWVQHPCPAGLVFNPHAKPGPVCDWPENYLNGAPYVLNDPSLEGAGPS